MATYKTNPDRSITKTMAGSKTPYVIAQNDPKYRRVLQESVSNAVPQPDKLNALVSMIQQGGGGNMPGGGNAPGATSPGIAQGIAQGIASPAQPQPSNYENQMVNLVSMIQAYQKANPVQVPFAAGTPTLAGRQFTETQNQNNIANQLSQQQFTETQNQNNIANQLSQDTRALGWANYGLAKDKANNPTANLTQTQAYDVASNDFRKAITDGAGQGITYTDAILNLHDNPGKLGTLQFQDAKDIINSVYTNGKSDITKLNKPTAYDLLLQGLQGQETANPNGTGSSSGGSGVGPQSYQGTADKVAAKYGVPANLVAGVIQAESSWNPNAKSPSGTMGLMQLMPGTAKSLGVTNPYNAAQNIEGGVKYLSQMLKKYSGNVAYALAAYNAGPGNVDKYGGVPPFAETQNYVKKIMAGMG